MNVLQALSDAGLDVSTIISSGGLLTLLGALLTERLVTKARLLRELAAQAEAYEARIALERQAHLDEIANLKRYQDELRLGDAARYSELSESRDYYRDARLEEKSRADKATDQLVETVELTKLAVHAINSMNEAAAR